MVEINSLVKKKIEFFLKRLEEHGIKVEKAYIFGSYSKGLENSLSDIDIAIVSPNLSDDRFTERIRLMKLAHDIDSKIEPVPFNTHTFVEEDSLAWEIVNSGILIHYE
jgi:predicted nucleotidyltransferase